MKPSLGIFVAVCLLGAGLVRTQAPVAQSIQVTISVVPALSLTSEGAVDFGDVGPGAHTKDFGEGARLVASGHIAAEVSVRRPYGIELDHTIVTDAPTLTFVADLWGSDLDDPASARAIDDGSLLSLGGGGSYFFWVGGTIVVPVDAVPGGYSGTYTIEVEYN